MEYRKNDVYFKMYFGTSGTDDYPLINGTYTIDSFAVTSGQDPKNKIYKGLTVSCGKDGKMTFEVGRKNSESVATWFNNNISSSQSTFGHTAGTLNFAFLGTLQLTLTIAGGQETFTFYNIALAQGHTVSRNNWWFGGKNCSHTKNNRVLCNGKNSRGKEVTFEFWRGDNDVNTVHVTPKRIIDTFNWMEKLDDSLRLDEIMMPGSHDAGMSELSHCCPLSIGQGWVKTQSGSIKKQLEDGSRYFDIRVDYDHSNLVAYHRDRNLGLDMGCNGQLLSEILDQTKTFLTNHDKETVILKFSHIRDSNGHNSDDTKKKICSLLDEKKYASVIFKIEPKNKNINLATVQLIDLRGKMILVFDYGGDSIDTAKGRFRYDDGTTIQQGANITVFDEYSDTSNESKMMSNQLDKWWKYSQGLGKGHFFLLSWTLTASPPFSDSIESLAARANSKLPSMLHNHIRSNYPKPNIVYIDFLNNYVAQSIILCNFY